MTKKEELGKQIGKLNKQETKITKEIQETEEYKKLDKEEKKLKKKERQLHREIEKIKKDTTLIYLDDEGSPRYLNYTEYWGDGRRNIRKETLNSIKKGLDITNLSLLRAKEIEEIVTKLIDTNLNDNKEYQEKIKEEEIVDETLTNIDEKKDKLIETTDKIWNERQKLYEKLSKIESREQRIKDLKNPEKRKKAERWEREEEARKKLKNIDEKLGKIHTGVIKERIVNNLEDEDEEEN